MNRFSFLFCAYLGDGHQPALGLYLQQRDAALNVAHGEEEAVPALRPVVVVLHRELGRRGLLKCIGGSIRSAEGVPATHASQPPSDANK